MQILVAKWRLLDFAGLQQKGRWRGIRAATAFRLPGQCPQSFREHLTLMMLKCRL